MTTPIWTLDSRDFVMFDVMVAMGVTSEEIHKAIVESHQTTIELLADKGVDYQRLRSALTPQSRKQEIALLFDSNVTGNAFHYGLPVYERVLAALPTKSFSCALQSGDLIINDEALGQLILDRYMHNHRPVRPPRHTGEIYAIYINNLTEGRALDLRRALQDWDAYLGYFDCTYSSPAKDWMSMTVGTQYLKLDSTFIGPHADDEDPTGNFNYPGWPVDSGGRNLVSIAEMYFSMFLGYKIERREMPTETDALRSLNALSTTPVELQQCSVEIAVNKHTYIAGHKGGGFTAAELDQLSTRDLEEAIRSRLSHNYIYEMVSKEHPGGRTDQFNLMLEFPRAGGKPIRLTAGLEYLPQEQRLRLLTLF